MSIHRPPPLGRLRLATVLDAHKIMALVTESMSQTFRIDFANDIIYLIENSILSICQLDAYDAIIGFIAARDYPLIPSVHPSAWESFIWNKYKTIELNARNTLFIHLLCWQPIYSKELVDNMLKSIFMHDPYVCYIAMLKSLPHKYPMLITGQSRAEASFRRIQVTDRGMNPEVLPILYIADRTEVSPRLGVRRAVEEDNDDLVPIIENHSDRLRELYGDFYISELISRHPESDRVLLVCEHNELAVGVMILNTTVNYEALEESYVLSPFAGLRHLNDEAQIPRHADIEASVLSVDPDAHTDPDLPWEPHMKVNMPREFPEQDKEPNNYKLSIASTPVFDLLFDDDEEEFEYDIVNIDTELLRVPEVLFAELNSLFGSKQEAEDIPRSDAAAKEKIPIQKKPVSAQPFDRKLPEPVRYKGAPNAFLLEVFAMHQDYDERYGFDILEAAFDIFPNRDYCIMSLPSNHPPFPLLEHFTLVTPIGSKMRFISESLYVAHINSVRGNMTLRWGEHYDKEALETIMANAPRVDTLKNLYESTLGSKTIESFILCSERQPVGVIIVGPLENGTAVRAQYELESEPRRPGTDGAILAGVMSPVLEPHSRWFMRELLRQSRYSTLFWMCRLFAKGDLSPSRNLMPLASHMNPVHPRREMPNITGYKDLDNMFKQISYPYALWVLEKPLTSVPKVYVNNNIVVVGASRTGLAFLESLLMGPTSGYLTFSNVTLVSENGLATVSDCLKAADICVPREGRFTDRYIKCTPFFFYVDVISSVMIGIDRKKKCIQLKGGATKYYDTLVLTCGQQFQHPAYMAEARALAKEVAQGKPCDRLLIDNPKYQEDKVPTLPKMPDNVFLINSLFDANICLRKLMRMITDIKEEGYALSPTKQVVVYGDCIEAYSCLASLLELGIQPKMLVFVEPFPPEDPVAMRTNCFNNEVVDERVQASLEKLGISVIRRCYLAGWQQVNSYVDYLELMTPMHAISLNCFALFYYGLQAINVHAFTAINKCGLVYDGGLVVSPTFETNDANIFGAGTIVSYSRRLYATRGLHRNYCSEDIGEALARLFLRRLNPFVMDQYRFQTTSSDLLPTCTSSILGFKSLCSLGASSSKIKSEALSQFRRWQPVMKFTSPIIKCATLPGPLYYMRERKSGRDIPMGVSNFLPRQGHTLVTDKDGNYFSLRLNVVHVIESVTCLSHKPFSIDMLSLLYGKHEAVFNGLLYRYLKNDIDDFYEFFTQPWLSAHYQESFADLIEVINMQDMDLMKDLLTSRFSQFGGIEVDKMICPVIDPSLKTGKTIPFLDFRSTGSFRSVFEKYLGNLYPSDHTVDIPKECGQDMHVRSKAREYWDKLSGEKIVAAHLVQYLDENSVLNPHYAKPKPI